MELVGNLHAEVISSHLLTTMPFIRRHMLLRIRQVSLELFVDLLDDRLMQRLLVPLSASK